eukprot:TRINITY_DN65824_c0_g1_i1.p1 TRINITY_DN65824_c0_g1~~TRINITY_DN65824_c0_g1_i1.p1  ORF type:complete len:362 (-),score=31.49 TRINITY_DN65824_c0_g1_i1:65-1150(-)
MAFTIDDAFDLASSEAWLPATSIGGVSAETKIIPNRGTAIKFTYRVNLPKEYVVGVLRPEASWSWSGCLEHVRSAEIKKHFSAGDAVLAIESYSVNRRVSYLLQRIMGSNKTTVSFIREVLRRDFPSIMSTCIVTLPVGPDSDDMTCSWCGKVALLVSELDQGASLLSEFVLAPHRFHWLVARTIESMCRTRQKEISYLWEGKPSWHYLEVLERSSFIVLRLRRCSRGLPLSPVSNINISEAQRSFEVDGTHWIPQEDQATFNLCQYLQSLLIYLDLDPSVVWDRLDSRPLVYFQATVLAHTWTSLAKVVEPLMKKHQQAYRRCNGGSAAPVLRIEESPRFAETADATYKHHETDLAGRCY